MRTMSSEPYSTATDAYLGYCAYSASVAPTHNYVGYTSLCVRYIGILFFLMKKSKEERYMDVCLQRKSALL